MLPSVESNLKMTDPGTVYDHFSNDSLRETCKGAVTNKDMNKTKSFNGSTLVPDDIASPCGFLAKNYPEDDYKSLKNDKNETYIVSTTGLIMKEEREKFVVDTDVLQWVKVDGDRFINWMVDIASMSEVLINQ